MRSKALYQIKEVARITGITVRALHYYDEIGLLVPKGRSESGYRLYSNDDLLRLQQILIGRELGFSLEDIKRSLDDTRFDRRQALLEQRRRLLERAQETQAMIRAIDRAVAILDEDQSDKGDTAMKEIFEGFNPTEYEKEAEERWGHTEAYRESKRRTSKYTEKDWQEMRREQAAIFGALAAAMTEGTAAESAEVIELAERHRLSIDRWFYPCSRQMHAGLADLYEADPRYAQSMDKFGAGVTEYLVRAIRARGRDGDGDTTPTVVGSG